MAKERLTLYDRYGNVIEYDISSASVTIDAEGKSLDIKLSEIATALLQAVTSVTFNGTPYNRENGKINIGDQMQADWNESSASYPTFIKNKPNVVTGVKMGANGAVNTPSNGVVTLPEPGSQATFDNAMSSTSENGVQNKVIKAYVDNLINGLINGAPAALDTLNELSSALGNDSNFAATITNALAAKANSSDIYTKSEVDEKVTNAGKVKSVSVNGTNYTPNSSGVVDLGTIQGAKGDKGDKGDTVVIDPDGLAQFVIANDLDTSDPTQGLSARQGKILKQAISTVQANLQAVVDALANIAFTSAKPNLSQIDWTGGTFYATINKTLSGCTTQNTNTEQVAEGQQFSMVLTALTGYTLTGAVISVTNSKGQSVAYTFDNNTNTLTIAAANVVGTINISVAAKAIHQISLGSGSSNVSFTSGTVTEAVDGSSWTGTIEAASGHKLPASISVTMGGTAVTPTYNSTTGAITIANVTGNIVITAVAEEVGKVTITKSLRNVTLTDNTDANGKIAEGATYNGTVAVEDRTGIKTKYTDTSFATKFPAGTFPPLKLTPAMIDGDGLTVNIAQDGLSATINGVVSSNKSISAVGETRMVRGRGISTGGNGTPGTSAAQSRCMNETPILVPHGVNAYVVHHNFKTISEELVLPNNSDYNSFNNITDRVVAGSGSLGGGSSQSLSRTEDETVFLHDLNSLNKCVYIWFSFILGLNNSTTELMQANLEKCWVKGYALPSGETDIANATAEYLLFDGSKSTLIEQSE